jgi:serine/threonine-protein kinase
MEPTGPLPPDSVDKTRSRVKGEIQAERSFRGTVLRLLRRQVVPLLLGLISALVFFNFLIMPRFVRHGTEIVVPDVLTLPLADATALLDEVGLSVRDTLVQMSSRVTAGHVLDQIPLGDTPVKPDRGLVLVVSGGRVEQRVPQLAGQTLRFARLTLNSEGYELGDVLRVPSDRVPRNFVVASDPAPDAVASPAERVNLLVSDGPEKRLWVMPDLSGKGLQLTADRLNFAGFEAVIMNADRWFRGDRIRATFPQPGTRIAEGDTIRLYGR